MYLQGLMTQCNCMPVYTVYMQKKPQVSKLCGILSLSLYMVLVSIAHSVIATGFMYLVSNTLLSKQGGVILVSRG